MNEPREADDTQVGSEHPLGGVAQAKGALSPGAMLGHLRIESVLGQGTMGIVYRAWDTELHRPVAVKTLIPSRQLQPDHIERLLSEARHAARLDHPNIVTVYRAGPIDGVHLIEMQLIEGAPLDAILRDRGALPPREALDVIAQVLSGLGAAHDAGILHRDIKPANLLRRDDGAVFITDFSISRYTGAPHLTVDGALLGTPDYMAPEVWMGPHHSAQSDLYAVGITLFTLLRGRAPFLGDGLAAHHRSSPLPLEELSLSPELQHLLLSLTARAPSGRPTDARAALALVRTAQRQLAPGEPPDQHGPLGVPQIRSQEPPERLPSLRGPDAPASAWSGGRRVALALGILGAVGAAAALALAPPRGWRALAMAIDGTPGTPPTVLVVKPTCPGCTDEVAAYDPRTSLLAGAEVRLRWTLPGTGYVRLYNVDGEGRFQQLEPRPSEPAPLYQEGEVIDFPTDARGVRLGMGTERLWLVWSADRDPPCLEEALPYATRGELVPRQEEAGPSTRDPRLGPYETQRYECRAEIAGDDVALSPPVDLQVGHEG